ncbi:MAG: aldo/keto reductase [Ilumatobacteraceae bacterium]
MEPLVAPTATLADGTTIPRLGFGVWQIGIDEVVPAVAAALDAGYRHVDTAAAYGNEQGVGRAVRASGLDRSEVTVVTKLRNGEQGYDAAIRACRDSIERLGLGPIDLYLIHWAAPRFGTFVETWRAFVTMRDEGLVRSIGVSNFNADHLEAIIAATGVTPVVNQVELHPYLQQPALRAFHAEHGIATEAWSPLGQGRGLLDDPTLADVAAAHGATPAQVALAWQLALGNVAIPKSVSPARIRENLEAVELTLDAEDLARITALDRAARFGADPETVTFTQMPG